MNSSMLSMAPSVGCSMAIILLGYSPWLLLGQHATFHDDDCELATDLPGTTVPRRRSALRKADVAAD